MPGNLQLAFHVSVDFIRCHGIIAVAGTYQRTGKPPFLLDIARFFPYRKLKYIPDEHRLTFIMQYAYINIQRRLHLIPRRIGQGILQTLDIYIHRSECFFIDPKNHHATVSVCKSNHGVR